MLSLKNKTKRKWKNNTINTAKGNTRISLKHKYMNNKEMNT